MKIRFMRNIFLMALAIGIVRGASDLDTCIGTLQPIFQGSCISDWASIASTAVELNWCLKNPSTLKNIKISTQDMLCNCKDCHTVKGNGCLGGRVKEALKWIKDGNSVGGSYQNYGVKTDAVVGGPTDYFDCLNYFIAKCEPSVDTNCVDT